jgi:hypothetical protein
LVGYYSAVKENVIGVVMMFDWLRRLFHIKKKGGVINSKGLTIIHRDYIYNPKVERPKINIIIPKAGSQAIHKDLNKFMRVHGKQLSTYRKSVKAKVRPEEEN